MSEYDTLFSQLNDCTNIDAIRLRKRLRGLSKIESPEKKDNVLKALEREFAGAKKRLQRRNELSVNLSFPESLPISAKADEIATALQSHQVIIVAGETGSGKTTQLPKICLKAGLGRKGVIGHTQPRRLAARTVSNRIAEELNTRLGDVVGYQVRFTDQVSESTAIKLMTDGILLSEIKRDRFLNKYDAIIIDEAHERSLNIDFLLGYLKQVLAKRKDLKLIVTSATIDVERFSKHFNDAPIFKVSGRTYPVDVFYRPSTSNDEYERNLYEQISDAIEEIVYEEKQRGWRLGDVLVFLPGEREIRECSKHLKHCDFDHLEVLPLYARLNTQEQNKIFASHSGRRVVLSTNVAETSITVPGIRYVIDSGLVRMSRYSYRSKIQRLPIEAISQASANQRAGRCGRVSEGICYRLYSEEDYVGRPKFSDPEILRTNLAAVILKMLDSGLGEVHSFPFIDLPERKQWNDGFKLLFELGAVDTQRKLTSLGKQIATIPTDPRLGRMLIAASEHGCLSDVLVIVSALSIQDPRDRPAEKQQQADQAHAEFKDADSDFISFLNLWNNYEQNRQELSSNQLKKYSQKSFLSFMRMREWRDIHRQLLLVLKELKLQVGHVDKEVDYDAIHKSLLSGLLGNIGRHDEKREYVGCRNRRFQIFPGSALTKRKPKWLLAAELVETQQVYARYNARIEPEWIEPLASHLVKKAWSEPHWEKKRAQVVAYERVSLYGLDIVSKRPVNYGQLDEKASREIFIRSGLIEGLYEARSNKAIKHNRELVEDLEALENRTRRRDIVVDDETIFGLYDHQIPPHIVSGASFEKWYKRLGLEGQQTLFFNKEQFTRSQASDFDPSLFPNHLENNGIQFPLSYHFNPGEKDDGVTVSVPLQAIRQLSTNRLDKLVPGMLREKCTQLIKNLPRTLRKHFVPVPDIVDAILPKVENSEDDLITSITRELKIRSNVDIPYEAWNFEALDRHLKININVLDDAGKTIEQGRDLTELVQKLEDKIDAASESIEDSREEEELDLTGWTFDTLEKEVLVKRAGIELKVFPALQDKVAYVKRVNANNLLQAEEWSRLGIARLIAYNVKDQIGLFNKELKLYKELALLYAPVGQAKKLYDDFALSCVANHFVPDALIFTRQEYLDCIKFKRGDFIEFARDYSGLVRDILFQHHKLMKQLKSKVNLAIALPMTDLQGQLRNLVYDGFLSHTPYERLTSYPRYLEAAVIRHEKMARNMGDERKYVPMFKQWWDNYESRYSALTAQGIKDKELENFRWMLEEMRVSCFAQRLGTEQTVSEKRLNKQWELVQRP